MVSLPMEKEVVTEMFEEQNSNPWGDEEVTLQGP
jgi:hypothetical protein